MSLVSAMTRSSRTGIAARIRRSWSVAMNWTPNDQQLRRMAKFAMRTGTIFDGVLKAAVVLAVIYLAIEIGSAFLPGGAVSRVLGGLR